jgi:hypothetical protein
MTIPEAPFQITDKPVNKLLFAAVAVMVLAVDIFQLKFALATRN